MSYLIEKDVSGHIVYIYDGLLLSADKAAFDDLLQTLRQDIPSIEEGLSTEYGKSVLYKYYLGKCLSDYLDKFNVAPKERKKFWDEIKDFATQEERKREDGKNSKTRSFYEQCYVLSQIELDVVEKLSWRQWQDLLDRISNREDERIYNWIKNKKDKIREDDWREFEKALHLYLKDKDTSVFTDTELYDLYDSILNMCSFWRVNFLEFAKTNSKSAKIKSKARRSKKYHATCYDLKKQKRSTLNEDIYSEAFKIAMT